LIDPVIVAGLCAPWVADTLQLRSRQLIEGPAFSTVLPCRCRSVKWSLALATIEASKVSACDDCPDDAVAIDVQPARCEPANGRIWTVPRQFVNFRQGGRWRVRPWIQANDRARGTQPRPPD